ncbi:MAG: acyl-CoA dehydratase activase-related protein [Ignavibacteria bacterium]
MTAYKIGIDIGSTTAKVVLTDESDTTIYTDYIRHNTLISETLLTLLNNIYSTYGDIIVRPVFSGSAAMGIAENSNFPFVQEVIAAASLVRSKHPAINSLIDIGGEDAKLILFNNLKKPDIKMNGNCAGGTGAYIDQMATILNVSIPGLNDLAWQSSKIYPIASRCGVFAKTDVQNLISRKISTADIAASIFEAVACQTINSLARGCTIKSPVLFCGGPLTYINYLRKAFSGLLNIKHENIIVPEHAELFTAMGASLSTNGNSKALKISEVIRLINSPRKIFKDSNTLNPLFNNEAEVTHWNRHRHVINIPARKPENGTTCFLGIDSGSTTTKIVVTDSDAKLLYRYYRNNNGHPLETVIAGLNEFSRQLAESNTTIHIAKSAVTGYGEELIKSALDIDYGLVETVAHFLAAKRIEPEVSFILDIGGQDIKAIFVQNNTISKIEINEACSSGCGSFIEGFANTLGYSPGNFANLALSSRAPYDLGSRCTVFMNSKVKQALRDGATVADLSAGLAYSVIKNCLNKVLRITNYDELGKNIVVQGGAFKNKAVFRSLEILSGKKIVISDKPELTGAYGAALFAMDKFTSRKTESSFVGLSNLESLARHDTKLSVCKGCTNHCQITIYKFPHGGLCYSGNKCEKTYSNNSTMQTKGRNIFDYKRQILFSQHKNLMPSNNVRIGIPRTLNMYENYPFWQALFSNCGFEVVLSDESSYKLYKNGTGEIMSDNICFPAKLAHGHIVNLLKKKVERIFLPIVLYEKKQFKKSANSYNCPIITGYPEVLKNICLSPDTVKVPFDSPCINFNDPHLLKKACQTYFKSLGITGTIFNKAFETALAVQSRYKFLIKRKNEEILEDAVKNSNPVVMVAGHPYHADKLVHQEISQILSDFGVNIINEEIAINNKDEAFDSFYLISQWEYPSRILQAAWWVSQQKYDIGFIQLNSFGCGPDSFLLDEIGDFIKRVGLSYSQIRIDEISSPGSIKLRLRSLIESQKLKQTPSKERVHWETKTKRVFKESDKKRTILAPWFSDFYSPFIPVLGKIAGYKIVNLPPSDSQSVSYGLEYANNEICYPATLVVGDTIKVLKNNEYNQEEIAIGITQTGGQCRATNYIALIKRAMANAGFSDIPVVAIGTSNDLQNFQSGFRPNWLNVIKHAFVSLLFADSLSRMFYSTVCRGKNEFESFSLRKKYLNKAVELLEYNAHDELLALLKEAIQDFNSVPIKELEVQTVGIVGEIYIKYNTFGQFGTIEWLIKNNVEVVLPPLMEFFTQLFINSKVRIKEHVNRPKTFGFVNSIIKPIVNNYINKFEKALKNFRFYRPAYNIDHSADLANDILNLNHQYGEGWLIPAEIAGMAKQNINNIICLQPFGCIANHIVGKGMEKKIKNLYPDVNLLFLDFDYGTSKVNILNRIHFLINNTSLTINKVRTEMNTVLF